MKRYTADPFQYASAHHPLRMRLLFVLILALIPLFSSAYAQIEDPDSADTETARSYLNCARQNLEYGHYDQAIINAQKVLDLSKQASLQKQQIVALILTGESYIANGQYQKAIHNLQEALRLNESTFPNEDNDYTMLISDGMGKACQLLNEFETALSWFQKSIYFAEKTDNPAHLATSCNNLGRLYAENKYVKKAVEYYQKSAEIFNSSGKPEQAYQAYLNIIKLVLDQEQSHDTLANPPAYATRALIETKEPEQEKISINTIDDFEGLFDKIFDLIQKNNDSIQTGYAYISNAQIAYQLYRHPVFKHSGKADMLKRTYDSLIMAGKMADTINNSRLKSYALGYLARLYEDSKRVEEAVALTNQAIYHAQESDATELLFRWEGQLGRLLQINQNKDQAVSAYQRALFYLDTFREDLISDCRRRPTISFRNHVGPIYFGLSDLLLQKAAMENDTQKKHEYLMKARRIIEQLKQMELQDLFQDQCIVTLQNQETSIEQKLDHTAVIYPIILPRRMEILITFPDGLKQHTIPVDMKLLNQKINTLRRALEDPGNFEFKTVSKYIYDLIITPVEQELNVQSIHTLIFVPDGSLRTIPMAALYDGQSFLVDKFAVVVSPGMNLTEPRPIDSANLNLLLAGISESVRGLPALPGVAAELKEIQKLFDCDLLMDKTFQLETIEHKLRTTPYSVVHIASHGQFNRDPKKTFLLAYDKNLTIDKLEDLMALSNYRKTPVELLTLSACQTAAGDELAALGLAGVALKSGARSAIASLWSVNDRATAKLVTGFYKNLKTGRYSKATALQKAQQDLIKQGFSHPSHWAPFLLIGNWL